MNTLSFEEKKRQSKIVIDAIEYNDNIDQMPINHKQGREKMVHVCRRWHKSINMNSSFTKPLGNGQRFEEVGTALPKIVWVGKSSP